VETPLDPPLVDMKNTPIDWDDNYYAGLLFRSLPWSLLSERSSLTNGNYFE
jgi:hypothetical protein